MATPIDSLRQLVPVNPADEQANIHTGYQKALAQGFKGSLGDFFDEQAHLYLNTPESDPRHLIWISGNTLAAWKQLKGLK